MNIQAQLKCLIAQANCAPACLYCGSVLVYIFSSSEVMTLWRYTNLRIIFFLNQEHKATNDEKNHKKDRPLKWHILAGRLEQNCCAAEQS